MSPKLNTVRTLYKRFNPKLIVCDFDGTMTTTETITPLIQLAEKNWSESQHVQFAEQLSWYNINHQHLFANLLHNLSAYKEALVRGGSAWSLDTLKAYFTELDALDRESVDKLNSNGQFLQNIKLLELSEIFKRHMRHNVIQTLREMTNDDNVQVKTLSHNWSSFTIRNALNGTVLERDIVCNELECDAQHITTGTLSTKCVTSIDKLEWFLKWKHEYVDETKGELTMYIGDESGDFLANCCSDISVWFTGEQNESFLSVVNDKYLMNKAQNDLLFVVNAW
eukprot:CAMPEP_0202689376 /NCGR_PEP_ID=MMETSP1385-20130828/4653_1 /ASSEMBLY_ACC=CAM_ASM_000861 /TAXON_ID=933848 /ORGANISM="Elphidium margaritaceum" /LENGTH=280 /DNA_ID=CAMNT_0049344497 /DNA_START=48 /DNA_END=887 /DNA_ORIENTATION=+